MSALTDNLLTNEQIYELGRLHGGLLNIKQSIERLNAFAKSTGLELRPVETLSIALMGNDISVLIKSHERAEEAIAAHAYAVAGVDAADMARRAA